MGTMLGPIVYVLLLCVILGVGRSTTKAFLNQPHQMKAVRRHEAHTYDVQQIETVLDNLVDRN